MKSRCLFDLIFQIFQKIILERNDLSTCSAYQVMMMMSFFSIKEFSDEVIHGEHMQNYQQLYGKKVK